MAVAPAGDETLSPADAVDMLDELLEAQNHHYVLGLKLKLPVYIVDSICAKHSQASDRLLHILIEFIKSQVDPLPTWRTIIDVLRTPAVNLLQLAKKVEAAHFPDLTSVRVTEHSSAATSVAKTTAVSGHASNLNVSSYSPEGEVATVKSEIKVFHRRFNSLKEATIQCLESLRITVMTVIFLLTSISADSIDEHKVFLEEKHKTLYECKNHMELFACLNLYWNYLAYDLLDQLIDELREKEKAFDAVRKEMDLYKEDIEQFRVRTPLKVFCQAQRRKEDDPPPGFREIVAKHNWPDTVMLEDVEKFRQRYMFTYNLRKCALMLNSIGTGSFVVVWFVPVSIVKALKKKRALKVFKEFEVSRLEIAGSCVYQAPIHRQVASLPSAASANESGAQSIITPASTERSSSVSDQSSLVDEDYPFVERPPEDYFCPVTFGLLVQPHLTSCCGKHLSQEAATRIQRGGGACPLCKTLRLTTVLNKHFLRQVHEVRVFCRYEERGCGWQGELADFERHARSCPMSDAPLMTELLKLPIYGERESIRQDTAGSQTESTAQQSSTPPAAGTSQGRKGSKAIRIVNPDTLQEVDVSYVREQLFMDTFPTETTQSRQPEHSGTTGASSISPSTTLESGTFFGQSERFGVLSPVETKRRPLLPRSTKSPDIGSKISLISMAEIRYEGVLYAVDTREETVALANVHSFGTEDRQVPKPIPPRTETYEFIIFRGSDIKDLHVSERAPKTEDAPQHPVIVSANSQIPPVIPPSSGPLPPTPSSSQPVIPPSRPQVLMGTSGPAAMQSPPPPNLPPPPTAATHSLSTPGDPILELKHFAQSFQLRTPDLSRTHTGEQPTHTSSPPLMSPSSSRDSRPWRGAMAEPKTVPEPSVEGLSSLSKPMQPATPATSTGTATWAERLARPRPLETATPVAPTRQSSDPIQISVAANQGWLQSMESQKQSSDKEKTTAELYHQFQGILNKLTPQNFQTLAVQALELRIDTEEKLKGVVDILFAKVWEEPQFCSVYANLCKVLSPTKVEWTVDGDTLSTTFRRVVLTKSQQEFEKDRRENEEKMDRLLAIEDVESEEKRKELTEKFELDEAKARKRAHGNTCFIGELFCLKLLNESAVHECIVRLLKSSSNEESLECAARLITIIGKDLDVPEAKPRIDGYFDRIHTIIARGKISPRVKFMLKDVLELRENNWVPRRQLDTTPKTIDQIRAEVGEEEQRTRRQTPVDHS